MILLTGGTGRLGKELRKLLELDAPKRNNFNILREPVVQRYREILKENYKMIVHCAAYTDVVGAEENKQLCYDTNVIGTRNLAATGIPMIYISTEYVFDGEKGNYNEEDHPNPVNFYALTKLLGEYEARQNTADTRILRCLFKPRPFEHQAACADQFTTGDYVDVMAKEIALAIQMFNKLPPLLHIGTERKSTFELAKKTKEEVRPIYIDNIRTVRLPRDTSLNTSKWRELKCKLTSQGPTSTPMK